MQPQSDAEKELLKENLYLNRIQEILRKSRGFLQEAVTEEASNVEQYSTETTIIDRVVANERNAFVSGIVLSGLVFTSVRFGPRFIVTKLNPEKARMLRESDDIAEKAGTRWMQKTFSFLFELSFGAWAGWRGYSILSSQNNQSYDEIAKIPLCAGRSRVSDKVCPEIVHLVYNEIPPPFWSNLNDGDERKLKDPKRWRAVRTFADNCIKRSVYEESYRKQHGVKPETVIVVPEGGVPEDILLSQSKD